MSVDQDRLNEFVGRTVGDIGAAMTAVLVHIGDKLGLYKAMAGAGPMTSAQLAGKTGTAERYVREWLSNQAASGYIDYDPRSGRFLLNDIQAMAFAHEDSPALMTGAFQVLASMFHDEPAITAAFQSGKGVGWGEHDHKLFEGTERFFRGGYSANLVSSWLPALDGMIERLKSGAAVADVGCGHGASTVLMAQAFPKSRFVGFDNHPASIERAGRIAQRMGVAGNCRFAAASSTDFPGPDAGGAGKYDLVACFDCLHDMGDPAGCARHVRGMLMPDGAWMIVEPFAGDRLEDNLNPVGRVYYAASTMICVPASLAYNGPALGAQAGEARLREVATSGGFSRFRRASQTPFNLVLEARP